MLEQINCFERWREWKDDAEKAWRIGTVSAFYLAVKMLSQHQDSQFCEKKCLNTLEGVTAD